MLRRSPALLPTCCSKSEHDGIDARRAFAAVRLQHLSRSKALLSSHCDLPWKDDAHKRRCMHLNCDVELTPWHQLQEDCLFNCCSQEDHRLRSAPI